MFLSLNFLCLSLIQASYFIHAFPTKDVESDLGATLIMPLQNRAKSTPGGYLDLPAMANHIREKHGFPTVEPPDPEESDSLQRRATSNNVDLSDDGPDVSYFATISVGTPPQKFGVVLDTGSSDLILSSTLCTSGCAGSAEYSPTNSRSSHVQGQSISLSLASLKGTGQVASDNVMLGGFRVNPQTFVMAETIEGDLLNPNVHGLLGLGFQPGAKTKAVPFVQALVNDKKLKQPVMSFHFERHLTDPVNEVASGGALTLGDVNERFFNGTIEHHPVKVPNLWTIGLESITSQDTLIPVPETVGTALIDTGVTLIGAPSSVFTTVCQNLGGTPQTSGTLVGFCIIPCDLSVNGFEMAFTFVGGQPWIMNSKDITFIQQNGESGHVCVTAIFDLTPRTKAGLSFSWIIGLAFLKNVYTVFDFGPPSVGFAALPSEIPPLPVQQPTKGRLRKRPLPTGTSTSLKSGSGSGTGGSSTTGSTSALKGSKFPCVNGKKFGIIPC